MKKYLVDTTIFIRHFRSDQKATKFLDQASNIVISYIVLGELWQGVISSKQQYAINDLMKREVSFDWGNTAINKLALELVQQYRPKYSLGFFDCLLAATAILNGYYLITDNIKHFQIIKGLKVNKIEDIISL
jgi:predicted nucleic acid-binding protein